MKKTSYFNHRQFDKVRELELFTAFSDSFPLPVPTTLEYILCDIKSGKYAEPIQTLRQLFHIDPQEYKKLKQILPCFTPCATVKGQKITDILCPSGVLITDYDKIADLPTLQSIRKALEKDPYTYSLFLSPSGYGLKALILLADDKDNTTHHEYYAAYKKYIEATYPLAFKYWDSSGSDITRLCFVSHDPDLFVNPEVKVWKEKDAKVQNARVNPPQPSSIPQVPRKAIPMSDQETDKVIRFLEGGWNVNLPMTDGHRHDSSFKRAREMAEWGIVKEDAEVYFSQFLSDANDPDDILKQINNAYQKANFGSKKRTL